MKRTPTAHLTHFTRPSPSAVTYNLSIHDVATITVPRGSQWTSGLHWHTTHDEFLQIVRGRARVTLGAVTKEYVGGEEGLDGEAVIEVPRGVVHEWRRADGGLAEGEDGELVVREWTAPADGGKEVFFRVLNSCLMEPEPARMYTLPVWVPEFVAGVVGPWIERWAVTVQLFTIFAAWDNWPVLVGSGSGWVSWSVTLAALRCSLWVGGLVGMREWYEEYVGTELADRVGGTMTAKAKAS